MINRFIKITRYIAIKKLINITELTDIYINIIFKDFKYLKKIIINKRSLFISKFWRILIWYL